MNSSYVVCEHNRPEIHPEMLKAADTAGLFWLTTTVQCHTVQDRKTGTLPIFKGGIRGCFKYHYSSYMKTIPWWRNRGLFGHRIWNIRSTPALWIWEGLWWCSLGRILQDYTAPWCWLPLELMAVADSACVFHRQTERIWLIWYCQDPGVHTSQSGKHKEMDGWKYETSTSLETLPTNKSDRHMFVGTTWKNKEVVWTTC